MSESLKLLSSPLSGRFFRVGEAPSDILAKAMIRRWPDSPIMEGDRNIGWCRPSRPWAGDLEPGMGDAAYRAESGVVRMWLREEVRKLSKVALNDAVEDHCTTVLNLPSGRIRRRRRSIIERELRPALRRAVTPKRSIIPVVLLVSTGDLWVGSKGCHSDLELLMVLRSVFPFALLDTRMGGSGLGFESFALAALSHCVTHKTSLVAEDVRLLEARLTSGGMKMTAGDPGGADLDLLTGVLERDVSPTISQIVLSVSRGGSWTDLVFDSHGLLKMTPAKSRGGFLSRRYSRRFSEGHAAFMRCGQAVLAASEGLRAG